MLCQSSLFIKAAATLYASPLTAATLQRRFVGVQHAAACMSMLKRELATALESPSLF
jgi:hypothetical protein